jgi:uncharacterized Zn finger protein
MSSLSPVCPSCGETEKLRGTRKDGSILLRCETCGHRWKRDLAACPRCGSHLVVDRREPLMQKARGTQQSIVGFRIVRECSSCGNEW